MEKIIIIMMERAFCLCTKVSNIPPTILSSSLYTQYTQYTHPQSPSTFHLLSKSTVGKKEGESDSRNGEWCSYVYYTYKKVLRLPILLLNKVHCSSFLAP